MLKQKTNQSTSKTRLLNLTATDVLQLPHVIIDVLLSFAGIHKLQQCTTCGVTKICDPIIDKGETWYCQFCGDSFINTSYNTKTNTSKKTTTRNKKHSEQ